MEALLNTSTMEQATEYLLTHPPPLLGGAVRVRLYTEKYLHSLILKVRRFPAANIYLFPTQDLTMSEEDQMMRAIAMSLGQEVSMEQRSDSPEVCHPVCLKFME